MHSFLSRDRSIVSFYIFLSLGLLVYTTLRAHWLSMTCDEASTYFSHVPRNLWTCFFSDGCWGDANNHLLNTFFIQRSINVFGVSELSIRLPNLFGHILYLTSSILIVRMITNKFWLGLVGFCLMNLNPYLIEFFSLARGYGLGTGFIMGSIYFLFSWIKSQRISLLCIALLSAVFAVLSNFVFLNFYAVLVAIFVLFDLKKRFLDKDRNGKNFGSNIILIGITSAILFFLLRTPIQVLRSKGEFVYGADSFIYSIHELVKSTLMNQRYFSSQPSQIFLWLSIVIGSTTVVVAIALLFNQERKNESQKTIRNIYFASVLILILMIFASVFQNQVMGVKYLLHRKSIVFIPLLTIPVFIMLAEFSHFRVITLLTSLIISSFLIYHFFRSANFYMTREWYYDAETKNMIQYIKNDIRPDEKVNLSVYWIYEPASHFYVEQYKIPNIQSLLRLNSEDIPKASQPDYIYVERNEEKNVNPDIYSVEKEFGWAGILFKKDK